jgi:hypothetical protein
MTTEAMQTPIPKALSDEIAKMRRNASNYHVSGMGSCTFCGTKEKHACQVKTAASEFVVGAWCPTHGWLHFDSVAYPPTERLTASEVEDRKLDERRKAEFARRKQRDAGYEAFAQEQNEL